MNQDRNQRPCCTTGQAVRYAWTTHDGSVAEIFHVYILGWIGYRVEHQNACPANDGHGLRARPPGAVDDGRGYHPAICTAGPKLAARPMRSYGVAIVDRQAADRIAS